MYSPHNQDCMTGQDAFTPLMLSSYALFISSDLHGSIRPQIIGLPTGDTHRYVLPGKG